MLLHFGFEELVEVCDGALLLVALPDEAFLAEGLAFVQLLKVQLQFVQVLVHADQVEFPRGTPALHQPIKFALAATLPSLLLFHLRVSVGGVFLRSSSLGALQLIKWVLILLL